MMKNYPCYIVDAFTQNRFAGNQAAVCLIPTDLKDEEYQKIAREFQLSETAFPTPRNGDFRTASHFGLRWFTPTVEVPLCGHATLATSHTLFNEVGNICSTITFSTQSGDLVVHREGGSVRMDFPHYELEAVVWPPDNEFLEHFPNTYYPDLLVSVIQCLIPQEMEIKGVIYARKVKKVVVIVDPETTRFEFKQLVCDFKRMVEMDPNSSFCKGVTVALSPRHPEKQGFVDEEGVPYDYVCRHFAPWLGIDEDPATGAAQCVLAPIWSKVLNIERLYAFQAYPGRGAQFRLQILPNNRLSIIGKSVTVVDGNLRLDTQE